MLSRRLSLVHLVLCTLVLLAGLCRFAAAAGQQSSQPAARSIEGIVQDSAGKPTSGAVVLLKEVKSLQIRSYIADKDGKYRFHGLNPEANYEVRARLDGLSSKVKTISVFDTGSVITINLKLSKKQKEPK